MSYKSRFYIDVSIDGDNGDEFYWVVDLLTNERTTKSPFYKLEHAEKHLELYKKHNKIVDNYLELYTQYNNIVDY